MPFSQIPENVRIKCFNCGHIGIDCLPIVHWCAWCVHIKDILDWTNQKTADEAKISKVSVDRVMRGDVDDLRVTTMQAITRALLNGLKEAKIELKNRPCCTDSIPDTSVVLEKCQELEVAMEKLTASHKAEIAEIHAAERTRIDFLKEQIRFKEEQMKQKDKVIDQHLDLFKRKNRAIGILGVCLGISLVAIIAALIIDIVNPNVGFFWLAEMFDITQALR